MYVIHAAFYKGSIHQHLGLTLQCLSYMLNLTKVRYDLTSWINFTMYVMHAASYKGSIRTNTLNFCDTIPIEEELSTVAQAAQENGRAGDIITSGTTCCMSVRVRTHSVFFLLFLTFFLSLNSFYPSLE